MLFPHNNNIENKIRTNYKGVSHILESFYKNKYIKFRDEMLSINFQSNKDKMFIEASKLIDTYLHEIDSLCSKYEITSQSKLRPTLIEEISSYLFTNNKVVKAYNLSFYNKGIFAGLKLGLNAQIKILKKDVDFCIGKSYTIKIAEVENIIIVPIVAVEVKTFLDATMFGEAQYSSRQLKNATPNVSNYILMEYNQVGIDKIVAARSDNSISEMFALKRIASDNIDANTLHEYYAEVCNVLENINDKQELNVPGRLLRVQA